MKKEAIKKEVVFQPLRWLVHVTVANPETGKAMLVSRHDCRDRHHAAVLLSEVRELAEDLAEFLPGLAAVGYELAQAVSPDQPFGEAVAESGLSAADQAHWQSVVATGEVLGEE